MHKDNKCSHLYCDDFEMPENNLEEMFSTQLSLQEYYHSKGMASDPREFNVDEAMYHWNTATTEFFELVERIANHKDIFKYSELDHDELMEIRFEIIDIMHFIMNIGLYLQLKIPISLSELFKDDTDGSVENHSHHFVVPICWGVISSLWGAMLNDLPYKKWKKYTGEEKIDINKISFSFSGMIQNLIAIARSFGIDEKMFYCLYKSKVKENVDRQKRGY